MWFTIDSLVIRITNSANRNNFTANLIKIIQKDGKRDTERERLTAARALFLVDVNAMIGSQMEHLSGI